MLPVSAAPTAGLCELLSALGQETRLSIVRKLLDGGPRSVNALAEELDILQNGASTHLTILARAGLVVAERRGSQRIYHARRETVEYLIGVLENMLRHAD